MGNPKEYALNSEHENNTEYSEIIFARKDLQSVYWQNFNLVV